MQLLGHKITRDPRKPLHDYQQDAVKDTEESWGGEKDWDRSLIVMPTGSGKSLVTGEICAREIENGGRCLFLAHTKDLVFQPKNAFEEDFGCQSTIEMADLKADDSPMVFASVQTMVNRVKKGLWRPDTFQKCVLDEAHRTLSAGHSFVAEFFGKEGGKIAGCTATPRRGDRKDLFTFYDGISYDKKIQELWRDGYLVEPTIFHEPLGIVVKQEKPSDVTDAEVGEAIEPYLDEAADRVMKYAKGRCGISFLPLRKTARLFCQKLNERGLRTEYIGGDVDPAEQKAIKKRLLLGKTEMVCNAMIWGEGTDIRPCNLLVDLRPTMSWPAAMQKWGRATRTYDPSAYYAPKGAAWGLKRDAWIIDFCFETERHSMLQRPSAIIAKDEEEAKQIDKILARGGGGNLMEAMKTATNEREESLRKRLEAMRTRKSRQVSAADFFLSQKRMDLVEYEPEAKWELEPITQKQREMLERSKFDMDTIQNKGHASKVLDMLFKRINEGMCSVPQATFASSLGHPDPYSVTFSDMKKWLDEHAPKKNYGPYRR